MLKKGFILTFGMLTVFMMLGGCANNTGTGDAANTVLYGQITAIDGSSVTIAVGAQPQRPQMDGAQPQDGGQADAPPNGPQGGPPSGDWPRSDGNAPDFPSGDRPRSDGNAPGGMTLTGEEQTFTVTDSTVITVRSGNGSETGALADLKTGDIITVQADGGMAKSITVMRMTGSLPEQDGNSDSQGTNRTNSDVSQA